MTYEEMSALFEKYDEEFLEGDRKRPRDLEAFNKLQKLAPVDRDVVSSADHDEIWLAFDAEKVAEVVTEQDVIKLLQLGVRLDDDNQCFSMFV